MVDGGLTTKVLARLAARADLEPRPRRDLPPDCGVGRLSARRGRRVDGARPPVRADGRGEALAHDRFWNRWSRGSMAESR